MLINFSDFAEFGFAMFQMALSQPKLKKISALEIKCSKTINNREWLTLELRIAALACGIMYSCCMQEAM